MIKENNLTPVIHPAGRVENGQNKLTKDSLLELASVM